MLKEVVSAGIIGVGACIPEKIMGNDYWEHFKMGRTPKNGKDPFYGIKERRVFDEDMVPSDAEVIAGKKAIEDAGLTCDDIDLVMVQSMIQDEILPGNASLVQHKLGLKKAGAWNVDTCCSSFVTMTTIAANLIALKQYRKILIITSAFNSQLADYSDYLCIYLGDGAGAVVMGEVPENRGFTASHCTSNGYYHDAFILTERLPYNVERTKHYKGSEAKALLTVNAEKAHQLGKHSVEDMKKVLDKVLKKSDLTGNDINLFLSHQPCHWAHSAWRDSVNIPEKCSYQTFMKYGNIASATVPINLYEAKNKGILKDGDNLLIASSGAGENHVAAVLKWYSE